MRKIASRVTLTGIVIFVYSGLLPSPVNGGPSELSVLEPASGVLFGLYYGAGSLAQTAVKLGRTPAVHLTYYAWAADWTGSVTKADLAQGRIPLVNWEPHHIDFAKIIDGSLDATIMARANSSKALGKKFFLDFAAEMNGDEAWSGNNAPLYVSAFRHIHDLFVAAGATNVVWVGARTSRTPPVATGRRWITIPAICTLIGPESMGTTGVQRTAAGRPSARCSKTSTPSLQRKKSRF